MPVLGKRVVRLSLGFALLLTICSACLIVSARSALADPPNDYPTSLAPPVPQDSVIDPWRFYNRECTSFVAWRLNNNNGIPFQNFNYKVKGTHFGDAQNWGNVARSIGITVNHTPAIGAVAWWYFSSTAGHVAWVTNINSNGSVVVQDYNWGYPKNPGQFLEHTLTSAPTGYIHFQDLSSNPSPSPSTPAAVSRSSNSMDVFYNDGYNHIVNYFWGTNGWQSGYWSDSNIAGQPTVIDRTSNNLDVFYRTTDGKLEYRAWTTSNGWGNVVTMVSRGVAGDPWAIARGSNDMQILFLYNSDQMASINWDINLGWNLTPQILYNAGATTDPVAISRNSNSMDVFFGKNNGNLVHIGWDPVNGWLTSDFSAGTGVDGRPTAIFRNGGNDMSVYYKEQKSGKVAEEFWNINNGWAWQDWNASLSGIPSAIRGINNTIDDFYKETGGNIVDRYFSSCGWCTTNIVNAGGSTGNPTAIVRGGTSIEVFYWDGTALMDANWNTGSHSWRMGKIN